jgi:hypothetical protein
MTAPSRSQGETMGEYLKFDKMFAPLIIQVIFWVGVVIVVLSGLVQFFSFHLLAMITGLLTIVIGPLIVRLYCELIIVAFKIYETLREIRDNTRRV